MLASIKSFAVFLEGYYHILRCYFSRLTGLVVRHTGKVETCYGGVQTTLFAGITVLSYSKHLISNLSDQIDERNKK